MKNRKDFVASLARGIEIIRAFTSEQTVNHSAARASIGPADALTLSQVAEKVGVARAVARRFLLTLAELGYVVTDGKYFRLTARVLDLGYAYLSSMPFSNVATEFLQEVAEQTRESCSASVLDGQDIVYVARVAAQRILSISLSIGARLPAYCTSMGRVLLAALPGPELESYLSKVQLRRRTPQTVTDKECLRQILSEVGREGYALTDGELEEGLRSIAVPVRSSGARVIAAINVSTQAGRVNKSQMVKEFLPLLRKAAQRIGAVLPPQAPDGTKETPFQGRVLSESGR
jgi:IclR family transcriptional regulator, pca regulon regulatory protein